MRKVFAYAINQHQNHTYLIIDYLFQIYLRILKSAFLSISFIIFIVLISFLNRGNRASINL